MIRLVAALIAVATSAFAQPNVLFLAIDDLNDWIEPLGGHAQAKTPNLKRLAARGVTFQRTYTAAPLCNPSRTAILFGRHPFTTGVTGNNDDWRTYESLRGVETLPVYFRNRGYWTASGGKIFHANHGGAKGAKTTAEGAPYAGRSGFNQPDAWDEGFPSRSVQLPLAPVLLGTHRNGINHHWDWGPLDHPIDETEDGQTSRWAASVLMREHEQPFFLAVGLYKPHDPQYAPARYFLEHPLEDVQLPAIKKDDLDDIPRVAKGYALSERAWKKTIEDQHKALPAAVQAYLASVTFADAMAGRILDALESSDYLDNTIIVMWSDHGYHLGEKEKYHKSTLWEESTRVPLIIVAPGVAKEGAVCERTVSLVDVYPTLLELAGLPKNDGLDGESLVPLLKDPGAKWERPAISTRRGGSYAVRTETHRYIRYGDGSEELYDHRVDPNEWENLAGHPGTAGLRARLSSYLPK